MIRLTKAKISFRVDCFISTTSCEKSFETDFTSKTVAIADSSEEANKFGAAISKGAI